MGTSTLFPLTWELQLRLPVLSQLVCYFNGPSFRYNCCPFDPQCFGTLQYVMPQIHVIKTSSKQIDWLLTLCKARLNCILWPHTNLACVKSHCWKVCPKVFLSRDVCDLWSMIHPNKGKQKWRVFMEGDMDFDKWSLWDGGAVSNWSGFGYRCDSETCGDVISQKQRA